MFFRPRREEDVAARWVDRLVSTARGSDCVGRREQGLRDERRRAERHRRCPGRKVATLLTSSLFSELLYYSISRKRLYDAASARPSASLPGRFTLFTSTRLFVLLMTRYNLAGGVGVDYARWWLGAWNGGRGQYAEHARSQARTGAIRLHKPALQFPHIRSSLQTAQGNCGEGRC